MMNTKIHFTEERNGYNREQVDNYINKLSEEYQTMYGEHQSTITKYNDLLDDVKKLDVQEQTGLNPDIIAKTLLNAEKLAQDIIADVHTEAAAIKTDAQAESKRITDDAYTEKARILLQSDKIIEDAKAEAARIMNDARQDLKTVQNEKTLLVAEINKIVDKLKSFAAVNETISTT